jgi:hypothetical protein
LEKTEVAGSLERLQAVKLRPGDKYLQEHSKNDQRDDPVWKIRANWPNGRVARCTYRVAGGLNIRSQCPG